MLCPGFLSFVVFFNLRPERSFDSFHRMEEVLKILLVDDEPEARELGLRPNRTCVEGKS